MAAAKPAAVTVTLRKQRETKGTFRYESDADDAALRTLYLPKPVAAKLGNGNPDSITVTITAAA